MHKYCTLMLLCILCASCSPRPGSSFGFVDGKPIHIIRENTKEECLRTAEDRCRGGFVVLEEGPLARYQGGWVEQRQTVEHIYSVRVKCDNH